MFQALFGFFGNANLTNMKDKKDIIRKTPVFGIFYIVE